MSRNLNPEPISVNDSMIPPSIRDALFEIMEEEYLLYKVETDAGVEWWLMDGYGELIEAFWVE